ncbi:MAG: hypothetical protein ACK5JH_05845 [Anaerocolumna sp.]
MSTRPRFIGFIGLDAYDLILYLGKYLDNLGQKVLIIDYTENGRLTYLAPTPITLNPNKDYVRYQNMDFFRGKQEEIQCEEYHYILIDFGWNINQESIKRCEYVYIITDLQQQNFDTIYKMQLHETAVYILLKNYFHDKNINNMKEYFQENHMKFKKCYLFPTTLKDIENMVMLQYYHQIKIHKISRQLKNLIYTILIEHLDYEEKEVYKIKKLQ